MISGGFTFFSERIRKRLKLDFARANTLGISKGKLTGTLFDRPWGDIVDGAEKRRVLLEEADFQIDYAAVRDPQTLMPVEKYDRPCRALIAARIGTTRLIDNMLIDPCVLR